LDDLLWATVAVNAATRVEIAGVSAAKKNVITRPTFRVRISCSFSASVRVNGSVLEAVATALIESGLRKITPRGVIFRMNAEFADCGRTSTPFLRHSPPLAVVRAIAVPRSPAHV